jgi:putative transposase
VKVLAHIREQYSLSLGSYGRPRMTMELKEAGRAVGECRVGRLMRMNVIKPVRTRRHKVTTDSNHRLGVAVNCLDGDFVAAAPSQKCAGEITYVWNAEGWPYLAVILDLHSDRVVGWAASDRMKKDLAIRAQDMAVRLRQSPEGCLFHSDRGSQYCSYDYQKKMQAYGLCLSMSGKGNCYDNASVETFFKSLKAGLIWRQKWSTRRQAEAAIFQHINGPEFTNEVQHLQQVLPCQDTPSFRLRSAARLPGFMKPGNRSGKLLQLWIASRRPSPAS